MVFAASHTIAFWATFFWGAPLLGLSVRSIPYANTPKAILPASSSKSVYVESPDLERETMMRDPSLGSMCRFGENSQTHNMRPWLINWKQLSITCPIDRQSRRERSRLPTHLRCAHDGCQGKLSSHSTKYKNATPANGLTVVVYRTHFCPPTRTINVHRFPYPASRY